MKRDAPDHPKTQKLAHLLAIPQATAVGLLELLWHFTARYAFQGDIGKFADEEIARGAGWIDVLRMSFSGLCQSPVDKLTTETPDKLTTETPDRLTTETPDRLTTETPDKLTTETPDRLTTETPDRRQVLYFVQSLLECRLMDKCSERRLLIHDWHIHADDAVRKRLKRYGLGFLQPVSVEMADKLTTKPLVKLSDVPATHCRLPEPEPEPEPEPAALTVHQAVQSLPGSSPPATPTIKQPSGNSRPIQRSLIPWLRSELHAYVQGGTGVCRSWDEPDEAVCVRILAATHGADSNAIERWLQVLFRSQQYPELNYAWFETMAEKRFGKKASSLERAGESGLLRNLGERAGAS